MTGNKTRLPLGEFDTIRLNAPYVTDPWHFYTRLCQDRPNNLLLESVEIDSKPAPRACCWWTPACASSAAAAPQVRPSATTAPPRCACWSSACPPSSPRPGWRTSCTSTSRRPIGSLTKTAASRGSSVLDVLRTLQRELQCQQGKEALFMAGSFAYDLIASFEDLPEVPEGSNDCPDYCFYVAETPITIDHIKQSTQLVACLFGGEEDEQLDARYARLTARLESFKQACQQPLPAPAGHGAADRRPAVDKGTSSSAPRSRSSRASSAVVTSSRWCRPAASPSPARIPVAAYRRLKQTNPSPYMFYVQDEGFTLFGASPRARSFCANSRQVEMYPIAGPAAAASTRTAASTWIWTAASSWSCVRTRKRWPST